MAFRIILSALFAMLLWLGATSITVSAQEQPASGYQAHVLMPSDFAVPWTDAERQAAWRVGLPVPHVLTTPDMFALFDSLAATAQPRVPRWRMARLGPIREQEGWHTIYRATSSASTTPAIAPQSCHSVTLPPSADRTQDSGVQFVCVFDQLPGARNLMAQFLLHLEGGDDSVFVGVSTDGTTFRGRRWRGTVAGAGGAGAWSGQRLFAPFGGQGFPGNARVAVLFVVAGDRLHSERPGAWLGDMRVEQYTPRSSGPSCAAADPQMQVPGVRGGQAVSKGLNLPAYPALTPSGLAGHVARLRQSGVHWVRLEWQARLNGVDTAQLEGPVQRLNYLDLRHYDALLELLCAPDHPIGVLALIGYFALPDDHWKEAGRVDDAYLHALANITELLGQLYGDRIGHWEIWNEPDFVATYLAPADYARLLTTLYTAAKAQNAQAQVVFGGLGGSDWVAARYFEQVTHLLPPGNPPYDIFAIHPYPSREFRRGDRTILDPSYLRYTRPTVLEPFMQIMRAAGHAPRPIWITEVGWNRAADSSNPSTLGCEAVYQTMVTGVQQAAFLPQQFDILFQEAAWGTDLPAVAKIFWYQYMDSGLEIDDRFCVRQGALATRVVDWWYGLYSGTDGGAGIFEPQPNLVECSFRAYPDAAAINRCLAIGEVAGLPQGP